MVEALACTIDQHDVVAWTTALHLDESINSRWLTEVLYDMEHAPITDFADCGMSIYM